MSTITATRSFSRQIAVISFALAGTIGSFAATTSPVHAAQQRTYYSVQLAAPVDSAKTEIVRGVLWKCAGDECSAARDTSRAVNVCARLAKKVGPVAQFATPEGQLSTEELAECNDVG